jgi:hypothetical protein
MQGRVYDADFSREDRSSGDVVGTEKWCQELGDITMNGVRTDSADLSGCFAAGEDHL